MDTLKQRSEMDPKYQWDIADMYPDEDAWEKDLARCQELAEEYAGYQGRLTESSQTLLSAYRLHDELWQIAERVYTYAHMKKDEDNRVTESQAMNDKAGAAMARIATLTAFTTPELLATDSSVLLSYLDENKELSIYRYAIEDLLRQKDHVLSKEEEHVLAQMSEVTPATGEIFTMLNNAEMDFGTIKNEDGEEITLTHGNYITMMQSHDRDVRKAAYTAMYEAYKKLINTIATTYNFNTKTDVVAARIRRYGSAREAALAGDNIPLSVYDNLVKIVGEALPTLHRYMEIRKRLLSVDELAMYDAYVPLIRMPKRKISYEEGLDIIRKGLTPLGSEYLRTMNAGLKEGWVDVYENEGKTSGAYSFGSYDSKPYILLNYTDTLQDVFTVVHEMGHSMHSWYTRHNQPFVYGGHSIFTAETASTVNENLLMKHLIREEQDLEMKKYLLNMHIEEFRTTLFRQTMFAEFEQLTHQAIEDGETLTADWMSDEYEKLNEKYFGPAMETDDLIRYEWARIPHFYNAFYVYKYATGYSAAAAISDAILEDHTKTHGDMGDAARRYIEFLKTGDSDDPIELLKIAGVDMSSPEPIRAAMNTFSHLVDEFETMTL